jgi:hypothetical protein
VLGLYLILEDGLAIPNHTPGIKIRRMCTAFMRHLRRLCNVMHVGEEIGT